MVKKAFTMIEMIFAIVLIAIVVVAVPQIMTRNAATVEGNRAQEAVFLASAAAKRLLSFRWDANSKDTNVTTPSDLDYAKVLDLDNAGSERVTVTVDGSAVTLPLRVGHIREEKHRRLHSVITTPAGANLEGTVTLASLKGANAFKFNYNMVVTMNYTNTFGSFSPTGTSNTKMATIRISNTDTGNTDVLMRIFAFNIGEIDYAKRTFQ